MPLKRFLCTWTMAWGLFGLGAGLWLILQNHLFQARAIGVVFLLGFSVTLFSLMGLAAGLAAAAVVALLARPWPVFPRLFSQPRIQTLLLSCLLLGWLLNMLGFSWDWPKHLDTLFKVGGPALAVAIFVLTARSAVKSGLPASPRPVSRAALVIAALFPITGFLLALTSYGSYHYQLQSIGMADAIPQFEPQAIDPSLRRPPRRIFLFGIDGLDPDLVEKLITEGKLPTLARLQAQGVSGPLQTLKPALSSRVWTTIVTGKLPEEHGIENQYTTIAPLLGTADLHITPALQIIKDLLVALDVIQKVPATSTQRRVKAIWNIASENGLSVDVVGWWGSWPAEAIRGRMVTDHANLAYMQSLLIRGRIYNLPGEHWTFPEDLIVQFPAPDVKHWDPAAAGFADLDDQDLSAAVQSVAGEKDDAYSCLHLAWQSDHYYEQVIQTLVALSPPNLFLGYWKSPDIAGHCFFKFADPGAPAAGVAPEDLRRFRHTVERFYLQVDQWLGQLAPKLPRDAIVIIVSDHGFQRNADGEWGHIENAPPGIILFSGPGIRAGARITQAHVLDVMPTLLYLLGLPQGQDMPGRVLTEVFDASREDPTGLTWISTYEAGQRHSSHPTPSSVDDEINRGLRALGYLK